METSTRRVSNWCGKGVRPKFTVSEDQRLGQLVEKYGKKSWVTIAKKMTNKTPKQCRERYENYVNPKITNSEWTNDEEQMLIKKYVEMGPHWVKLSKFFKTRSVNNIRNKWLMLKRKNQINLDIFPKMELIDSNDESSVGSPDNIDNIEKSELSDELDKLEEDIEAKDKLKSIDIPNFAIEEIENDNEDIFSFVESKVKDYPIFDTPRSDFELTMESFYPFF